MRFPIFLAAAAVAAIASQAAAAEQIIAHVLYVIDGDTIRVETELEPGRKIETSVRVAGVDTPEKGWRAKCDAEAIEAKKATDFVKSLIPKGSDISISGLRPDKYPGRIVAYVTTPNGLDLTRELLKRGLGVPYDGGRKSAPWCR